MNKIWGIRIYHNLGSVNNLLLPFTTYPVRVYLFLLAVKYAGKLMGHQS